MSHPKVLERLVHANEAWHRNPAGGISGLRTYLRTSKMSAFLRWIPESEFDLDLAQLADADIVLPEPGDPLAMVSPIISASLTTPCRLASMKTASHEDY